MAKKAIGSPDDQLMEIASLLRHLLAIELAKGGMNHQAIGKHLRLAKASVGSLLKGIKIEK